MKKDSIWNEYKNKIETKKMINDINTDILIIGGGITGLSIAYFLKDTDYKITLVDKTNLYSGVTSKTTAKITYLQGTIYQTLKSYFNESISKKYLDSQIEGITLLTKIINENNIECDLEKSPSILFAIDKNNNKKIDKEKELLSKWDIKVKDIKENNFKYGFKVNDTYTFNPIKYLESITNIINKKIDIYENVVVKDIKKDNKEFNIKTSNGNIHSKIVIIANHYPFFIYPLLFPLKTYVKKEYVNSAKAKKTNNYNAINVDSDLYSLRYYNDYIIYGSNEHKIINKLNHKKNIDKSRKDFQKYFNKKPEYSWTNQDIVSHDKLPMIGKIYDNLYVATAYNAWGMTNSTISGKIISDLILSNDNEYIKLFNPNRINLPLLLGMFSSINYIKPYVEGFFTKYLPKDISKDKCIYAKYKDTKNKEHKVSLICPHMKCPLIYNKDSNTWDCPCHGSKFTKEGKLLKGPAKKDITKKDSYEKK